MPDGIDLISFNGDVNLDLTDGDPTADAHGSIIGYSGVRGYGVAGYSVNLNTGNVEITSLYSDSFNILNTGYAIYGNGGDVNIRADGILHPRYGVGIGAFAIGDVDIQTTENADILAGYADAGVVAYAGGGVNIQFDGDMGGIDGSMFDMVGIAVQAISGYGGGPGGDMNVTLNGDIYATGSSPVLGYIPVIGATNIGATGNVSVNYGISRAGSLQGGLSGAITNAANDGTVSVTVGDGSTAGIAEASSAGSGQVTVTLGNGGHYGGAIAMGANTAINVGQGAAIGTELVGTAAHGSDITAGDDLTINTSWPPIIISSTTTGSDAADEASITLGSNATIFVSDPFSSDGAAILAQAPNGDAGVSITAGDGLALTMQGDYDIGIVARTHNGTIDIDLGTGGIVLPGGFFSAPPVTHTFSAGVVAQSDGGDIGVQTGADIYVVNNAGGPAYGISARTGGSGNIALASSGDVTATDRAISATTQNGDVSLTSSGALTASIGLYGEATGRGAVDIDNSGDIAAQTGILAFANRGGAGVSNTGAITGSYGIAVLTNGGNATVVNGGAIQADAAGIGGTVTGRGRLDIQNSATVHGDVYGIFGVSESGRTSVTNSGAVSGDTGISALSTDGSVRVASSGDVTAVNNGIEAMALGSGNVTVATSGSVTGGADGIYALTNAGNLRVTADGAVSGRTGIYASVGQNAHASVVTSGVITGEVVGIDVAAMDVGSASVVSHGAVDGGAYGIRARGQLGVSVVASGPVSGDVAILAQGDAFATVNASDVTGNDTGIVADGYNAASVRAGNVSGGVNAVVATSTLGDATVTTTGDVIGGSGSAVVIDAGAAASLNVAAGSTVAGSQPTVDISGASGVMIDNRGTIRSLAGAASDLVILADGGDASMSNSGLLIGSVDFSGSGPLTFTNSGTWRTGGMSLFSAWADTLTNGGLLAGSGVIDFGDGADTLNNTGTLAVGGSPASSLALANLETFNNSGLILFGSTDGVTTDGAANDRLVAQGTDFTGSDGSTLAMDVDLGVAGQANCSAATVADCFDLTGGSTAGSTLIRVVDTGQSAGGLNTDGIVLVDVSGGTSAAGDFSLDPTSTGYTVDAALGAGLQKGLFLYQLDYDAANERHRLISLPSSRAFEFAPLAASAQSVWYTSVGSWFDRQADLRDTLAAGDTGPGMWIKIAGSNDNRDATTDYGPYAFNISNKQDTVAVQAGIDLLHGVGDGQGFVAGLSAGTLDSDIRFKASSGTAKLEGQSYGAYASWLSNSFFLDAIVQQNDLDLTDHSVVRAKGKVKSTGGQVEGGWRMPVGAVSVEPLASLAYVRTRFDDLALPGATLQTEDAKSLRGSVGVRVTGDTDLHSATLRWQTTARVWDEFEGKNRAVLVSNGQSIGMPDDVSGAFGDVGVGMSLYAPSGHVSMFLNTGLKFKEDYRSTDTAVGFRVQW